MFSVVIPLYNKKTSIQDTIKSVLDQSFKNFEIIVINDGSNDGSAEIVSRIKDPRVRLIHQNNKGVSAARNLGIKESKHEWITFLDADDFWKPNHLNEALRMMDSYPNEMVYTTSFEYSDNRTVFRLPRNSKIYRVENYFLESLYEHITWTGVIFVKKTCFQEVGYFNTRLCSGEDLDMWRRLANNYSFIKSSSITSIYNQSDQNSLTKSKSTFENSLISSFNLKGIESFERIYLKRMLFQRLKLDVKTLDFKDILKILMKHKLEIFK